MKKTLVKKSPVHGRGLFANRDFQRGEKIIQYTGQKLTKREGDRRARYYGSIGYCPLLYMGDYYIDAICGGNDSLYINHSTKPNASFDDFDGQVWFFSTSKIKKGQEITIHYGYKP